MRAMTIVIPVSLLLGLGAAAQNADRPSSSPTSPPPAATTGRAGAPQAPVGHRQPTQGALPPAVRSEEDSRRQSADPLGPVPSICKNC